jgi:hypothetical protein
MPLKHLIAFILLLALKGLAAPVESIMITSTRDFLISSLVEIENGKDWNNLNNDKLIEAFVGFLNLKKEKSIFITDLDETLLTSKYFFGSTEWFKVITPEIREKIQTSNPGESPDQIERLLDQDFWKFVGSHPEMKSADQTYTKLLKALYENGHQVFALTARNEKMSDVTKMQLRSIGVDFLAEQVIYSPHNPDWSSSKGRTLRSAIDSRLKQKSASGAFYRMYFFDDMIKEINAVTEAFVLSPASNLEEVKIVHSRVSHENKRQNEIYKIFQTIGKFQEIVFNSIGLKISNEEAFELHKVIAPQKYSCYKFYSH